MIKNKAKIFSFNEKFNYSKANDYFEENGFLLLRGLTNKDSVKNLSLRVENIFTLPSAGGAFGFSKKDHYRKYIYPPLAMGKPVYEIVLNKKLIKVVENYIGSEPIISELHIKKDDPVPNVYFPLHVDIYPGWTQGEDNNINLNNKTPVKPKYMKNKLGVGCLIYLDDCGLDRGNFMFSKGTQKNIYLKGGKLEDYSDKEKKDILDNIVHLNGKAGDVVLFDDRGWHGPNQPAKKSRSVIEVDFTNAKFFGRWQKVDLQVPISSMEYLDQKQIRVLGKGAKALYNSNTLNYKQYKVQGFNRSPFYKLVVMLINNGFIIQYVKDLIKHYFAKILRRN
ncbi:MAG: hypothetical protein CBE11_00255 [Rickettsiales bacterium TMED251]|nr:MAG: hypothetical protein CBE11_00255 [Rickettsiales bacterium TMED251]|tara:strand:+ start:1987 stop:2994 length:1008 start_codon:yes stop_codon:yes gene_type:complete